jgi:hypothetical protein
VRWPGTLWSSLDPACDPRRQRRNSSAGSPSATCPAVNVAGPGATVARRSTVGTGGAELDYSIEHSVGIDLQAAAASVRDICLDAEERGMMPDDLY